MNRYKRFIGLVLKRSLQITLCLGLLSTMVGFRDTGNRFRVSAADPTVWVRPCDYDTVLQPGTFPAGDVLEFETNITVEQMLGSIFANINGVGFSFIRLALYPRDENNPGDPLEGDSAFTLERASTRTIDICFEDSQYDEFVGETSRDVTGNTITFCGDRNGESNEPAEEVTEDWTESILLCLGLDRPQETKWSILSYFWEDGPRIGEDDKAGLTFLYPKTNGFGARKNTGGLSCSPDL